MFTVNLNGNVYKVRFAYFERLDKDKKIARETVCNLVRIRPLATNPPTESIDQIAMGSSLCYHGDVFKRSVGRKLALARALKGTYFDRATRKTFWNAYFEKLAMVPEDEHVVKDGFDSYYQSLGVDDPCMDKMRAAFKAGVMWQRDQEAKKPRVKR